MSKASKTGAGFTERQLKKAYLIAFDDFATDALALKVDLGMRTKADANRLLKTLEGLGLVTSGHLNGERALTWQCVETYDTITRSEALARFEEAIKMASSKTVKTTKTNKTEGNMKKGTKGSAKKGAKGTGTRGPVARYTEAQIAAGLKARKAGGTNAEVAAAAGVKSPNYFTKVLKDRIASDQQMVQKRPKGSAGKGSAGKRGKVAVAA